MDISRFLDFRNRWQLVKDIALWFLCGFILLCLGNLLQKYFVFVSSYIIDPPDAIEVAAFFLLLILLFILLKGLFGWVKVHWWVFRNRDTVYMFNDKDWPDKWVFNGKTECTDEGYLFVKSSRAGCLLKDFFWKNFRMSFEMKFETDKFRSQKRLGLVFRAEDLDNYFMIEIGENAEAEHVSSIKPHVRYKGGWEIMAVEEIKESFNFSNFVKVSLEVKEDTARFLYKGTPIFKWVLPIYVDINHIESGVEDNREKTKDIIVGGAFAGHVQKIPFRLRYGQVGFRAHLKHGAIIRGLRIEPL